MHLLNSIHLYPPMHTCGAEYMAHWINKDLKKHGHEARVLLHQANQVKVTSMYMYDGIEIFPPDGNIIQSLFHQSDIILTHLDFSDWTMGMARLMKKPVVHLIHNTHKNGNIELSEVPQFIVYNSQWMADKLNYDHPSMVMHPACDWRFYDVESNTEKHEFITLINIDQNKGGEILREIANAMPHKKFLGVMGSYSEPAKIGQITNQPANVTIIPKTTDIKSVYKRTRVLIMPSKYESWGRTATEAMCSGIPVISSGTEGLRENCGTAGIYVERSDIKGWVENIARLDNEKQYRKASDKARIRSRELDPEKSLQRFREFVQEAITSYRKA